MSVSVSFVYLLLIGFAASCNVGDEGCWEDAAANFVQMKSHANPGKKAVYKSEEADQVDEADEAINADEAAKSEENAMAILKEATEGNPRIMKPLGKGGLQPLRGPPKANPESYLRLKKVIGKMKDNKMPLVCEDMSGAYVDKKGKSFTLAQKKCEGTGSKKSGKQLFKYAILKQDMVSDDGTEGRISKNKQGKYVIYWSNFFEWTQVGSAGAGAPGTQPPGPATKPLGPAPAPGGPSVLYEWFHADCSGSGIKQVNGDDPAAQKQCNARAGCVGWSVNYDTNVRRLRSQNCKAIATGKWIYFKKMTSK